jgi:hypothetical protein
MIATGLIGRKKGFYRMDKSGGVAAGDRSATGEYRPTKRRSSRASMQRRKEGRGPGCGRRSSTPTAACTAGACCRRRPLRLAGAVADEIHQVDEAMRTGYGWELVRAHRSGRRALAGRAPARRGAFRHCSGRRRSHLLPPRRPRASWHPMASIALTAPRAYCSPTSSDAASRGEGGSASLWTSATLCLSSRPR